MGYGRIGKLFGVTSDADPLAELLARVLERVANDDAYHHRGSAHRRTLVTCRNRSMAEDVRVISMGASFNWQDTGLWSRQSRFESSRVRHLWCLVAAHQPRGINAVLQENGRFSVPRLKGGVPDLQNIGG